MNSLLNILQFHIITIALYYLQNLPILISSIIVHKFSLYQYSQNNIYSILLLRINMTTISFNLIPISSNTFLNK